MDTQTQEQYTVETEEYTEEELEVMEYENWMNHMRWVTGD